MLDLNFLIEQQDLNRKSNLLKNLKISLESLMFENNNNNNASSWTSFNGSAIMFCRNIFEILKDGIRTAPNRAESEHLWLFLVLLLMPKPSQVPCDSAQNDFKSVQNQIGTKTNEKKHEDLLIDWIFYSLRHHSLLNQVNFVLGQVDRVREYFKPNSFLLDQSFVDDFLVYLRAFEKNNYALLSKIKKNLFQLNSQIEKCENYMKKYKSINLSDVELANDKYSLDWSPSGGSELVKIEKIDSFSNVNVVPISSSLTNNNRGPVNQHRRMHSFPNIQINLAKKEKESKSEAPKPVEDNVGAVYVAVVVVFAHFLYSSKSYLNFFREAGVTLLYLLND